MWKLLFIIILLEFIYTGNVFSLFCYVTNFETFKIDSNRTLMQTLQDCENYNERVVNLSDELKVPENVTLHCYTLEVSRDVVLQGCTGKGGCNILVDKIRYIEELNLKTGQGMVGCTDCGTDGCNNMVANYRIAPSPIQHPAERGATSLNCYYCAEPCETSDAREKICGQNIAKSLEAACSVEIPKGLEDGRAVRKCQVFPKDREPPCPENSVCGFCKEDLCNGDLVVGKNG